MMRINTIDNIRGIAFILMVIYHSFYFYDINKKSSLCSNNIIYTIGYIARITFILLTGYSLVLAYKKEDYLRKRLTNSLTIGSHALIISIVTYLLYPDIFVRFGILHFISFATLLVSFIMYGMHSITSNKHIYPILTIIILIVSSVFTFPSINPFINTISGANIEYNMMDWFPLQTWLPILFIGVVLGQTVELSFMENDNILTKIGKNSLNLYTLHYVLFSLVYKLL